MQHPYLFFSKADADAFREKIKTDSAARQRYEKNIADIQACLNEEFITEEQANGRNTKSQHADFGSLNHQANRLCDVLGTKYIIDGDEKCAERLKELLLHFISFERWFAVNYTVRTPVPWHADLCSTSTTLALAKIYDLIFDYLTVEEQKIISRGILEKGVYPALSDWALPENRIHALDSMGHNWWAVCISEPATAFLALSDYLSEKEIKDTLDCVDNALAQYMTYSGNRLFNKFGNFDDKGFFYESIGYNNYGTGTLLRYLWCNERYFGRNEIIRAAIPKGLCDAVMKMSYPYTANGKTEYEFLNFGDHGIGAKLDFFVKYCILNGIASSALLSCASTYPNTLWDEFINYEPQKLYGCVSTLPKTEIYSSGYAVHRSSWENDATLLAVKSGFCWNHSHNDSGSFIIMHKGKCLFKDDGTCNYDSPFYHAYYCQDHAHSVLKIGNKGRRDEELYRGTKFPGEITDYYESESCFFVQADCTGPMAHLCSRMFRSFVWIDNRILVIFDEIYAHKEDTVQFSLHYNGDYNRNDNKIAFDYEGCKSMLTWHYPNKPTFTERIGHPDHEENKNQPYVEFSTTENERATLLINTIELDYNLYQTAYEKLEGKNSVGIKITHGDKVSEIWFNNMADGHIMHDNSNNIIAGFDTDAYMLVITKDIKQNTKKVLAICASYLRRDKKVFISSFTKITKEVLTDL